MNSYWRAITIHVFIIALLQINYKNIKFHADKQLQQFQYNQLNIIFFLYNMIFKQKD